jgi:hypothetical protein
MYDVGKYSAGKYCAGGMSAWNVDACGAPNGAMEHKLSHRSRIRDAEADRRSGLGVSEPGGAKEKNE